MRKVLFSSFLQSRNKIK